MKTENKKFFKVFIISGLTIAGGMAGVEYLTVQSIRPLRFILHFLIFGIGMGLFARNKKRKKLRKTEN